VEVGVALGHVDLRSGAPVPVAALAEQAEEAEALGFDSVWLMDHMWIDRGSGRAGGHEPLVSLAYAAARTRRIRLGVLVLCQAFRHPGQLAREISALNDASGGRFIAGLGAGWYEPEFTAFGWPFDYKVSRFAEMLPAVRSLLHAERVTLEGRWLTLRDASVLVSREAPPVWVAAGGDRMLELTARHADGWNLAWGGADPGWLSEPLNKLRAACAAAGREAITISAGVLNIPEEGAETAGRVLSGSPADLAQSWRRYAEAGVGHLIVNLSESPFALRDRGYLARAGESLKEFRAGRS
jgi:alkanesulfonate monooxygenase SsuD/methylene tetrahydromethanopterin reductase-like flavin-dependent oxidoreductase (luciferase family)